MKKSLLGAVALCLLSSPIQSNIPRMPEKSFSRESPGTLHSPPPKTKIDPFLELDQLYQSYTIRDACIREAYERFNLNVDSLRKALDSLYDREV